MVGRQSGADRRLVFHIDLTDTYDDTRVFKVMLCYESVKHIPFVPGTSYCRRQEVTKCEKTEKV